VDTAEAGFIAQSLADGSLPPRGQKGSRPGDLQTDSDAIGPGARQEVLPLTSPCGAGMLTASQVEGWWAPTDTAGTVV
jgi:hypothetical protein